MGKPDNKSLVQGFQDMARGNGFGYGPWQWVWRNYRMHTSPDMRPPFRFTDGDLQEMTRLRQDKGHPWSHILKQTYPDREHAMMRRKFLDKMVEEDADPASQDPFACTQDAVRLRAEMKPWLRITQPQYPDFNLKTVWEQVFKEIHDAEVAPRKSMDRKLQLSAADCQEINRLRTKGKLWMEIVDLRFPGWNTDTVKSVYDRVTREDDELGSASTRRKFLRIAPAKRLEITRLRKEGLTWHVIAERLFPGWSHDTLRRHYLDDNSLKSDVETRRVFKTSYVERLAVARLRKQGKTWVEITGLQFPGWDHRTVYEHFRDENPVKDAGVQGEAVKKSKQFKMTADERLDIERLRKEGKPWPAIRDLKYPGWSSSTVRCHFRGGDMATDGGADVESPPSG